MEFIESKLSKNTKGIIPVYMAGYPCQMNEIKIICKRYNIQLIEDCAHAIGTFYKNKHVEILESRLLLILSHYRLLLVKVA